MHLWQREVERKKLKDQLLEKKKNVQSCVSQESDPMNSIPRKIEELGLNASADTPEDSQDAPGTKLNSGKRRQSGSIIQKDEPHERNPCAPSFEEQQPEETSRQASCSSKEAWKLARKYKSSSRELNYVFSPVKSRELNYVFSPVKALETQKIICLLCTMHNAEQGELSSDTMDTLKRSKTHMRLAGSEAVQINE